MSDLAAANQAAMWRNRWMNRARIVVQNLTAWRSGLAVTEGQFVQNINNAYLALNSGTTGATAPVQQQGQSSDGAITWQFVPVTFFKTYINAAPSTPA